MKEKIIEKLLKAIENEPNMDVADGLIKALDIVKKVYGIK